MALLLQPYKEIFFGFNMKKTQGIHFTKKGVASFFASQYDKLIVALFIIIIGFGFYLIYTLTYSTLINPQPIKQTEINIQQEKINLDRYNSTTEKLKGKADANDSLTTPDFL